MAIDVPTANCQLPAASGVISVAAVAVIATAAFIVATAFATFSLSELQHGASDLFSRTSFESAESCVEEAFMRLKRDSGFTGTQLAVGSTTCGVSVTSVTSTRTIVASSTFQGFTRQIQARVTLTGARITLNDWVQYDGF